MAEVYDTEVQERAYTAALKLAADQIDYINTLLTSLSNSVQVEEAYDRFTGAMLEPIIARYWIECKKVRIHSTATYYKK